MSKRNDKVKNMILIALFSTMMCLGAWLHFPSVIPATMQTFVVFCSLGILGSKSTFFVLVIYTMLGSVGLPVFSGFTGGVGALIGPTAGFLWGFFLGVPAFYLTEKYLKNKKYGLYIGYIIYIILHYIPGALWYCYFTLGELNISGILSSSAVTVLPFIVPDTVKMLLAVFTVKRLGKIFK